MFAPPAKTPQTVRYTGVYTPKEDGPYVFVAAAPGEDRYELQVDGKTVLDQPHREGHAPQTVTLPLHAGQPIHFTLIYHPSSSNLSLGFGIRSEQDLIDADTRKIAASADAVVLSVGFGPSTESEGFDRTFELPWGQDALIRAVSAVNKHTIVVITAGGAVDAAPWIDAVPAVLHNYYPGQAGGTALAEVLFGERSPEGRLPFSFDRSWATDPTTTPTTRPLPPPAPTILPSTTPKVSSTAIATTPASNSPRTRSRSFPSASVSPTPPSATATSRRPLKGRATRPPSPSRST